MNDPIIIVIVVWFLFGKKQGAACNVVPGCFYWLDQVVRMSIICRVRYHTINGSYKNAHSIISITNEPYKSKFYNLDARALNPTC